MSKIKQICFLLLMILSALILVQCANKKEEIPLFEGFFLTYKTTSGCWEETYRVTSLGEGNYKLLFKEGCPDHKIQLSSPKEYVIDKYGKILTGSDHREVGTKIGIWIPPSELDGSKVPRSFGDSNAKVARTFWEKWNVLVIKSEIAPVEIFYDVNTGFKVGTHTGAMPGAAPMTLVLTDTNAQIPSGEKKE